MRITFLYQSLMNQTNLTNSLGNVLTAYEKANKKQNLIDPSQSPSNYVAAYNLQRLLDDYVQYGNNAKNADGWLGHADAQLESITDIIQKLRNETAVYGANGIHNNESMQALAREVMASYSQLLGLGNSQFLGHYIFGGHQTDTMPFQEKGNEITQIMYIRGAGGTVATKEPYADLMELPEGEYSVTVTQKGDMGILRVFDKNGKAVVIDTNGTDDTNRGGNDLGYEMTFDLKSEAVLNTGRGFSIKLPADMSRGVSYSFEYSSGSSSSYYGDDGKIYSKIGMNQDAAINITGQELFMQNTHTIKGDRLNTVNGLPINGSTLFSQLDKTNAGSGDSITIKGTDHLGRPLGSAQLVSPKVPRLDMQYASQEERTITIGYGGKYYQVEIPAKGYKDIEELTGTINKQLRFAQYLGSESTDSYNTLAIMEMGHNADIKNLAGTNTGVQVDLSGKIQITSDGDRISFNTGGVGNYTFLSVTGGVHNALGFEDKTVIDRGKDTVFELGNEFSQSNTIEPLTTTHTAADLSTNPVIFTINGKVLQIDLTSAGSDAERESMIDKALEKAGFSNVTATIVPNGADYDVTFRMQNVNYNNDTRLSSAFFDGTDHRYEMSAPEKQTQNGSANKSISDFTKFVEELYGHTVDVRIDEGRLVIQDLRGGKSKLTFDMRENNQGMTIPYGEDEHILTGNYTGSIDQSFNITTTVTKVGNKTDVLVEVHDLKGNLVTQKTVNNYAGGEIQLLGGVKIVVDDKNAAPIDVSTFKVDFRGNSSLNFGEMNMIQEGNNANTFVSLKNLYDALMNAINVPGLGAPSAWRDTTLQSTAIPYFDGAFGGNFNASWKYEVTSFQNKSDFFIQKEFENKSAVNTNPTAAAALNFNIHTYNNTTGDSVQHNMAVNIAGLTTSKEIIDAVNHAINNDASLRGDNVYASNEDGKIVIKSGSGTQNIHVTTNDQNSTYIMGLDEIVNQFAIQPSSTATSTFDVHYVDGGGVWQTLPVNLAGYADTATALASIRADLAPDCTADIVGGKLVFSSNVGNAIYYDNVVCPDGSLGIKNYTDNYINAGSIASLDLSSFDVEQRTLSFTFDDAGNYVSRNILIPSKAYATIEELVAEVNTQLTAEGLNTSFTALAGADGRIMFQPAAGVGEISIEGDHAGSLGYRRTGDQAVVKVSDENGRSVQNVYIDTANKEYAVSDGVLLGFDVGKLHLADSFTGTVGSGVSFELGVLDLVENQILQAYAKIGNQQSKVQSTMTFQTSIVTNAEKQKSELLGGTDLDILKLQARYSEMVTAYEYAMAMTSKIMSLSILDYLR